MNRTTHRTAAIFFYTYLKYVFLLQVSESLQFSFQKSDSITKC